MVLFALLASAPLAAYAADKDNCKTIHGTYAHWNGHPPYERIKTSNGKMYGLISSFEPDTDLQVPHYPRPANLELVWDANEHANGDFLFCFSINTKKFRAYELEPVELGWIKSFTPADSSETANFIRELKIAAIDAANQVANSSQFKTVDVSFDYLDGAITNVDVSPSDPDEDQDKAVADAVAQATYPKEPAELKGKKLSVKLPIYFPAEKLEQEN